MKWKSITLKQYPIFSREWMLEAFRDDMEEVLGLGFKNYKSLDTGIYADEKEYNELKKIMVECLKKNKEDIKKLTKDWMDSSDKLIEYTKGTSNINFKSMGDKKLIELLKASIKKFKKTTAYIFMADTLGRYYENWLDKILFAKLKDKNKEAHYKQILTTCTKNTNLYKAHKKLLDIIHKVGKLTIEEIKKSEMASNDLLGYTNEFRWLGYDTGIGRDFTMEDTLKKVEGLLSKGQIKEVANNHDEYLKIIKGLGLKEEEKEHLQIMDNLIYARAYRGEANSIAGMYLRPLLEELAVRCNTDYESIIYLTFNEIVVAIENKSVDHGIVQKRKEAFGLLMLNGKISIYASDEVNKLEDNHKLEGINEVKGMIANRGKVKGTARIIIRSNEFYKVLKGDILITKMTTPEFMVVLEKCVGIVTDIGGITSHASIVSRELGIPAVIGTEIATKIFKDGDLIELDADRGVVRKLK